MVEIIVIHEGDIKDARWGGKFVALMDGKKVGALRYHINDKEIAIVDFPAWLDERSIRSEYSIFYAWEIRKKLTRTLCKAYKDVLKELPIVIRDRNILERKENEAVLDLFFQEIETCKKVEIDENN